MPTAALERPRTPTKLTYKEALATLRSCAPELSEVALHKALAQAYFETADFTCCWNYNWGNVRPSSGEAFYLVRCNEIIDGKVVWLEKSPFQAYDNHAQGCADWLKVLKSFPEAWAALVDDSVTARGFARALGIPVKGRGRYYTDDVEHYSKNVEQKWRKIMLESWGLRLIKQGDRGSVVAEWQELLGLNKTGLFDIPTRLATVAFQKAHGLTGDGIVGFDTWSAARDND